jgi:hypothetical protein
LVLFNAQATSASVFRYVPSAAFDSAGDGLQVGIGAGEVGHALAQVVDKGLKMSRIKSRQGVSGGGAGQAGQVQSAVKVAAVFERAEGPAQGIEEARQQGQEKLIDVELAVAMSRQLGQTPQVLLQQSRRMGTGLATVLGADGKGQGRHGGMDHAVRQPIAQVKILRMSRRKNPGRFWRDAHATV